MKRRNLIFLLLVNLLFYACSKENNQKPIDKDDSWVSYFEYIDQTTHIYISSLEKYDDNTIIFSAWDYNNSNPLYIVRNNKITEVDTSNILNQLNDLSLFYADEEKKIWTNENCIICYSPNSKNYRYWIVSSINGQNSGYLLKDKDGAIWESTHFNGLFKYTNNSFVHYFEGYSFTQICKDNDNNLYIGSLAPMDKDGVLLRYNYSVWDTIYTTPQNNFCISSISVDSKNNLWFGVMNRMEIGINSGEGLIKYSNGTITNYNVFNSGLTSNSVVDTYVDPKDNIWIGTYFGGICKYTSQEAWSNYINNKDIDIKQCFENIVVDDSSNIWSSIWFVGLVKFNENNEK